MTRSLSLATLVALVCGACAVHSGEGVGSSDEALTDFAGQAGIVEGTSEAASVRAVANNAALKKSDYVNTIGLLPATADAILAGRPFTTLGQMDALPQASSTMFVKIQTYARANNVPGLIAGADRTISIQANTVDHELEQWGRGLWEGFVSYKVQLFGEGPPNDPAKLVDGNGAEYPLSRNLTEFQRLPLPVHLIGRADGSDLTNVVITNVALEVLKTNPIPAQSMTGKYDGTSSRQLNTIGSDIPGVSLTFTASATFFVNFTNGDACDQLQIQGADGAAHFLKPLSPSDQFTVPAPVSIFSVASCISARLPHGQAENDTQDFNVQVSAISLGNPH